MTGEHLWLEGKYEVISRIKEGGMGCVYLARHRILDEPRVIKLIRPQIESDETVRARFKREARTAVRLQHPSIARFFDLSMDEDGTAFLVMEYIDGVTLEELLVRTGPPPLPMVVEIGRQALEAISYLHGRGVVHRDISPDNLMLTLDEHENPLVKLIDLGIAKLIEEEGSHSCARKGSTGTGTFLGKVRYASPEQFRVTEGVAVDARTDLYSLGLVLYELATGRYPYDVSGPTAATLLFVSTSRPAVTRRPSEIRRPRCSTPGASRFSAVAIKGSSSTASRHPASPRTWHGRPSSERLQRPTSALTTMGRVPSAAMSSWPVGTAATACGQA